MNRSVMLFQELQSLADKDRAVISRRFFKTGAGEYGEGDIFLGLTVPACRLLAKKYFDLSFADIQKVISSPIHEERLIALIILVARYKKATQGEQEYIYHFYLAHTDFINNWDLIDLSAEYIVGAWLFENKDKFDTLDRLAKSKSIWERRIAIMATFAFIKNGVETETFRIAEILLHDKHDLIQKAVGWMLREVGKRISEEREEAFLKERYKIMPRTMVRYAIERFPEEKRKQYLTGAI
jgi:3-methyladenine DNA glycosylase AlkD